MLAILARVRREEGSDTPNVAESFLRGLAAAQAEQAHKQALEDSKLRQMLLRHGLEREKIEDQIRARQFAEENLKRLHGQPMADLPSDTVATQQEQLPPAQDLMTAIRGLVSDRLPGANGQPQLPEAPPNLDANIQAPPFQATPGQVRQVPRAVQIPGVEGLGVPGYSQRPSSSEQLADVLHRAELNKAQYTKFAPGETMPALGTAPPAGPRQSASEFGQFQQAYAESLGKSSFAELAPQEKIGVHKAFMEARQTNGTAAHVGSFEDYAVRYAASKGKKPEELTPADIEDARKRYQQADDRPRITVNAGSSDDMGAIADAIIAGDQPPTLQGLYRNGAAVRVALAKKGFNLAQAETDWKATQKHIATLNGAQQTRMAQAVDNAAHSLDVIEDLANQWDGGKFPLLNKARLAAAKQGALGAKAQQIATQLEAQISDVTSELGNVYMGGNSPTDHALSLAAKNLSADWTRDQLKSALGLARKNLQIRLNSMKNAGVAGASEGNPYAPKDNAKSKDADAGGAWVDLGNGMRVRKKQ
jgi:hypothetical protein